MAVYGVFLLFGKPPMVVHITIRGEERHCLGGYHSNFPNIFVSEDCAKEESAMRVEGVVLLVLVAIKGALLYFVYERCYTFVCEKQRYAVPHANDVQQP
jgi:hypothetical protein